MRYFSYNAPFTLTLASVATAVTTIDTFVPGSPLTDALAFNRGLGAPIAWLKAFTYVLAHQDWAHLVGNLALLLLLGPPLEERFGATKLFLMCAVTAAVSAVLNLVLFRHGLLGASGLVFLFIVLSSFSNARGRKIPLTFVLVALLYLSRELVAGLVHDNVSQFGHLAGGAFGALFGFTMGRRA